MTLYTTTTVLALSLLQGSSAFTTAPQSQRTSNTQLHKKLNTQLEREVDKTQPDVVQGLKDSVKPPSKKQEPVPTKSTALPFLDRPDILDGSIPGDVGFDPIGFAQTPEALFTYREAEIKHARLAMLAAAGWPLSELFDKQIAHAVGIKPVLDSTDRAPSILNGGLGKISPFYWIACLGAAAAIDLYQINKAKEPGYFPGNLGFDPLGLYPDTPEEQFEMQVKEIKNGRLAMVAITAFAFQEFVQKLGVVDETSIFFKPFGTVVEESANSGYIPEGL